MNDGKLQWHPAFYAGIQIELAADAQHLRFEEEHLLGKKPMQIDVVIIEKNDNIRIKKSIGHIFKRHNIIEYKSPDDYVSVNTFYKTYAYACFYQSDTKNVLEISPKDITITFACSHYPREMLNHIMKEKGISVTRYDKGIYHLTGDIFNMQVVIIPELSKTDYYWLQNLRTDLKSGGEINELINRYDTKKQDILYQSLLDVIIRANNKKMMEEKIMCEALRELFADELRESKLEGETQKAVTMVKNAMNRLGLSLEEACSLAEISVETYNKNIYH